MKDKNERVGKVGGQAVIEGIMMRGKTGYTTAVRKEDGTIVRDIHRDEIKKKNFFFRLPIVRGVVAFIESLVLSFSTLSFAADAMGLEEEDSEFEKWLTKHIGKSITAIIMTVGGILGIALGFLLFMYIPSLISHLIGNKIVARFAEGFIKIGIFLLYIYLISFMKDIKRTFMYHGAEHKSIFCYEKGLELNVENIRKQKRFHPRCGTSFMFLMMFVGIFISILINVLLPKTVENNWFYVLLKILTLPVTMGIGYEIIRFAGKHDNMFVRIITAPGLWIQRLTTKEPDDSMIEVAIVALKSALPDEFSEDEVFLGIDQPQDNASDPDTLDPDDAEKNDEAKPEDRSEKENPDKINVLLDLLNDAKESGKAGKDKDGDAL